MDDLTTTTLGESIAQKLQDFIPDDATCISVKINIPDYDASDNNWVAPAFADINKYLKDSGVDILAISSGIHVNGRNQIPHVHYHFITAHINPPANPSGHRTRWLAKKGNEEANFQGASFKYTRLEPNKPKYQFLSYPLKEGIMLQKRYYQFDGEFMKPEMKKLLLDVGKEIYEQACALILRQMKCQERKQLALRELYDLVHKIQFSSFKQMMAWLDDNYISTLDLEEMPDPKNYKVNCQKIAVKMGILKYSDI